jgi:putative transposase
MDLPEPRRRQSGPNGGFLAQPESGRERCQIVSAQRNEEHSRANEDHVGRLCRLAPGGARDEGRGELPCRVKVRSSQYLNNLAELDHRRVKQRIRLMLGFKRFDNAVVTISGIELAEKIKKQQFKTGKLGRLKCDDDGTVERGTRSLSPIRNDSTRRSLTDLSAGMSLHQSLLCLGTMISWPKWRP